MMSEIGVLDRTGTIWPVAHRAAARMGGADVVDLGGANDLTPDTPRMDVLLLGPREVTAAGLRRASRWAAAHPASIVVSLVEGSSPTKLADLRAYGVDHLVRGPFTPAKLAGVLTRAFDDLDRLAEEALEWDHDDPTRVDHRFAAAGDEANAEELAVGDELKATAAADVEELAVGDEPDPATTADVQSTRVATVMTIASATGGCGKTFFATNAAYEMAKAGHQVLLLDTDLQFGEVAAALRVRHPYSVYDGLYDAHGHRLPNEVLADHFDEIVMHHELGFDVLTAPRDPVLADYVGARDADHVLSVASPRYDVIIVDTPPSLNEVVLTCLDRSDVVAVLATLDVPSLKNLTVFLDTLRRLHIDDSKMRLILNKAEADIGISTGQAQEAFNDRFVGAIPQDRAVPRSINAGTVLLAVEPRSAVSARLLDAISASAPQGLLTVTEPAPAETRSFWARIVSWFHSSTPKSADVTHSGGTP